MMILFRGNKKQVEIGLFFALVIGLLIANIILVDKLFMNYVSYLAIFHNGMTDANEYIKRALEITSGNYSIFPHHYSRSLLYMLFGVQQFPPTIYENLNLITANIFVSYLFLALIYRQLCIFYSIKNCTKIIFFLPILNLFSPGFIFLNSTFRGELFGLFILYIYLSLLNNDKKVIYLSLIALFISPLVRLSQLLTTIFVLVLKIDINYHKLEPNPLKYFFIINITLVIIYTFLESIEVNYFSGGWYAFFDYGNTFRAYINIENFKDLYLIFPRNMFAYLMDSLSFYIWTDTFNNPENFNYINSTIRILAISMLILFYIKRLITKNDNILLSLYFCMSIPVISSIGYFQTRYLIIPDIILYFIIFNKILKSKQSLV